MVESDSIMCGSVGEQMKLLKEPCRLALNLYKKHGFYN